ncbi:NAD(P)/FAD-dependent oxidoreductase [Lacinutrix sp. Hel_I_90]|uniref:NAD(P)/FAD-dependent oxidoreductase n=1 Tax=Lacinutrix sp. Hel_I_90 TaxID=1249999 RepID=UPI0005CA55C9|nr:FAD-dependent oxidoreductase [Lacinutrix sp. Hel_I_90]
MKTNPSTFDIIIIGGGLAGLTSAIHLSKNNRSVLLIEKNDYPKHKVCGEYISNEVLPYLEALDIDVFKLNAEKINRFELSTPKNRVIKSNLPLGGFGISRFCLDYALAKKAIQNKARIIQDTVTDIQFANDSFSVKTKQATYLSKIVIGAYGKRANLDVQLERDFIKNKSPFLAVKTHVKGEFPEDLVALHNFEGGYCGVSKVENDTINLCYITDFEAFKKYKDIAEFQQKVIYKNTALKTIFENSKPLFDVPLTISQISFETKNPIENHMLMCGDTAGMIHPLCGNGMSMAIRSAQMASLLIIKFFDGDLKTREALEKAYLKKWNAEFKSRLRLGHVVAKLFSKNKLAEILIQGLKVFPFLLPYIIKRTHGKMMEVK